MTNKTLKEALKNSVCAFCGKKGCNNECHTEWDSKMLGLQRVQYDLEELQYIVRKAIDSIREVEKEVDNQMDINLNCQAGWKKQKPKPVKKTG